MKERSVFLLLFFLSTCQSYCSVSTISGMNTADCKNRNLKSVPNTLRDDLKIFKIGRNFLVEVTSNSFKMYPQLSEIHLNNNHIKSISLDAFNGLSQIRLLDLSHNLLVEVPTVAFKRIQTLTVLILRSNPITSLASHSFEHLTQLLEVNLENCSIVVISGDAFVGVPRLAEINLSGNKLKSLAENSLDPIKHCLSVLVLQRNPWNCDCNLKWLRLWLETSSVVWKHSREFLACMDGSDRVKKMTWIELDAVMFVCPIKVISVGKTTVEAKLGDEVTFECVVHADPEPKVYWKRKDGLPLPDEFRVTKNHLWTASTHERRLLTSLIISNVSQSSMGYFVCVAENNATRSELVYQVMPYQQRLSDGKQGNLKGKDGREQDDHETMKQKIIIVALLGLGIFCIFCLSLVSIVLSQKCRWMISYKVTDSDVDLPSKSIPGSAHTNTLLSQLTSPAKVNSSDRSETSIKQVADKYASPIKNRSSMLPVNHTIPFYAVLPGTESQRHPISTLKTSFDPTTFSDKTIPRNDYKTFND